MNIHDPTEDHRSAWYRPPSGCTHCGIGERLHIQRWTQDNGWHTYTPPTQHQIYVRMFNRRRARGVA